MFLSLKMLFQNFPQCFHKIPVLKRNISTYKANRQILIEHFGKKFKKINKFC